MKFFFDHCVPRDARDSLAAAGHDCILLTDELPPTTPDDDVLAHAQVLNAVLVTLNGDFCDIVRFPPAKYLGIVALQLRGRPSNLPAALSQLHAYLGNNPGPNALAGTLLIVETFRVRIRT